MTHEQTGDADLLWEFATEVYARPGVANLCLRLQDEYGVAVNVLLYAIWASRRGAALDAEDLQALERARRDFAREVVEPLRDTRRRWKALREDRTHYDAIKAVELAAEREELRLLAGICPDPACRRGGGRSAGPLLRTNLEAIGRHYALSPAAQRLLLQELPKALAFTD